jgi:hypothetical protein
VHRSSPLISIDVLLFRTSTDENNLPLPTCVNDGPINDNELALVSVTVDRKLFLCRTRTNGKGDYVFSDVPVGQYTVVRFVLPRDATRPNSRLVAVVFDFVHAHRVHSRTKNGHNDAQRLASRQLVRNGHDFVRRACRQVNGNGSYSCACVFSIEVNVSCSLSIRLGHADATRQCSDRCRRQALLSNRCQRSIPADEYSSVGHNQNSGSTRWISVQGVDAFDSSQSFDRHGREFDRVDIRARQVTGGHARVSTLPVPVCSGFVSLAVFNVHRHGNKRFATRTRTRRTSHGSKSSPMPNILFSSCPASTRSR